MKRKLYSITIIFIIILLIISIFTNSNILTSTISFSTNLFIKNIFPSLFPMFVISKILVEIGLPKVLGNIFKKPMNFLFKTKGEGAFIFFMSMITGFPSSAKYIDDMLDKKMITIKDSEKILMFTFFSNPLFIVNTVGNIFFNNINFGFIILISHILGNIIIGLLFRNYNKNVLTNDNSTKLSLKYMHNKINDINIFKLLFDSIKDSLDILINIFGIVTFILIIINLLFSNSNSIITILSSGIAEMTTGLKYLSLSNLDINLKLLISMFFISFGGLSVHFQIMSILNKRKVKYLPFLIARILHGIISVLLLNIFMKMGILF